MVDDKALISVADEKSPDLAAVREKLAPFEATLNEAKALDEKERKGKLGDALYQGGYEQMLTHAGWLRDATNELIRVAENEARDPIAMTIAVRIRVLGGTITRTVRTRRRAGWAASAKSPGESRTASRSRDESPRQSCRPCGRSLPAAKALGSTQEKGPVDRPALFRFPGVGLSGR